MSEAADIAFLFDVDNTLLDYDRVKSDLYAWLGETLGADAPEIYRRSYEGLRDELGYADFLAAFQRCWQESGFAPRWAGAARFLLDYPFAERVYPGAREALAHVAHFGTTAIVSDGEAVLQPRKISHSGLAAAVDAVLIFQHKQHDRATILERVPARRYVMVDDKLAVLNAMKADWGDRLTAVFVRQGHYAREQRHLGLPAADLTVDHIGELCQFSRLNYEPDAA